MTPATAPGAVEEPLAPSDRLSRSSHPDAPGAAAEARARRRRLVGFALVLGALLRLAQYAVNRSLWLDEGLLVSNFLDRSWAGLLEPLHRGQTAPLGFLALEKLAVAALGRSEYALRLVPLLGGLATLALLPRVARRCVSRPAVPVAVAIVALAPFLVYYSSEVKQYALDALASVVVLGLAAKLLRRPRDRGAALALGTAGVLAVWLSQPVVFMLAGTGLVLGLRALRRGDRRSVAALAAMAAAWGVSFAGSYLVSRHQVVDPVFMRSFWADGFIPLPPRSVAELAWLPRALLRVFREPFGTMGVGEGPAARAMGAAGTAAGAVAFVAGCAWMRRRAPLRLALLLAPVGLALLASAVRAYPFGSGTFTTGGRVLIWLIPPVACVMAEGAVAIRRALPRAVAAPAFGGAVALLLLPSAAYAALSVPHLRSEVRPLLAFAAAHRRPGDVMYVVYSGQAVFEYYAPRYGWSARNTVPGVCARFRPERYLADLDRLRGRPRVWVLFTRGGAVPLRDRPGLLFDEQKLMTSYLDAIGHRLDDRVAIGASLYLYDLADPARARVRLRADVPPLQERALNDCRGSWEPRNQLR
ncbi:MAG: hypothetical protein ACJ8GN_17385 [Longimicrobiaceae bacterium]